MKVSVGSTNPVKIEAANRAFRKIYGNCRAEGANVSSGVSDMPLTFKELALGAKNRVSLAIKELQGDFGVGLEGGFEESEFGTYMIGVAVVIRADGVWNISKSGGILMPKKIIDEVKKGKELSDVMDNFLGTEKIKHKEGTTGFFTNNLIDRTQSFENLIIYAMARFVREEWYL